jgi:hypothetical protein
MNLESYERETRKMFQISSTNLEKEPCKIWPMTLKIQLHVEQSIFAVCEVRFETFAQGSSLEYVNKPYVTSLKMNPQSYNKMTLRNKL